ncbi:MAG TPA: hypothetical protein VIN06_11840 [Devosia sp.]
MKTTIFATLVALPLLLAATGESFAWSKSFAGTRDQVRSACAAVGGALLDGQGATHCFNNKNGTAVSCYDDGKCDGSGPGPQPRVQVGMIALDVILGAAAKAKPKTYQVPESLTSGGNDGAPAPSKMGSDPTGGWSGHIGHASGGGEIFIHSTH